MLATAVAGEAEAIVSGDVDLLTLKSYLGIEMLSPRQFVSRQTPSRRGRLASTRPRALQR